MYIHMYIEREREWEILSQFSHLSFFWILWGPICCWSVATISRRRSRLSSLGTCIRQCFQAEPLSQYSFPTLKKHVHCIVNCWLHKSVFSWAVCPLRMPSTLPLLAACMQTDVIDCQIPLTLITSLADESGSSPRCYLQERWRNNATVWINFQAPEAWL